MNWSVIFWPAGQPRLGLSILCVMGLAVGAQGSAQAQAGGFDAPAALQLKPARNMYVNVGYTRVRPKDKSSQFSDVTGPVVRHGDEFTPGLNNGTAAGRDAASTLQFLSANMRADRPSDYAQQGLGTPVGATVDAGSTGSPTISLGVYLNDEHTWAVEAYVGALPMEVDVRAKGRIGSDGDGATNLGKLMTIKQLGLIVFGKYVFGRKGDRFRPSVGLGGAYIVFFDGKVSPSVTQYVGGDSKINLKSAWGPGVFLGGEYRLDDRWSLTATMGYLLLKTEGTLVTRTNPDVLARSKVNEHAAADVGAMTQTAVRFVNGTLTGGPDGINGTSNLLQGTLSELARARTGDAKNLGTYVRRIHTTLNPLLFTAGVGYAF